jgi:phosphopantothenoylcysteine decarboxylase/phosphopantothenate--cysteine ligase
MTPFVKDSLMPILRGRKVLLGITGSIAAFKGCDIIRHLRQCGAEVRVVITHGAENFVTKTTLETLSGNPVLSGFWNSEEKSQTQGTHHIDTARWADVILVAPATANLIAKVAWGLADDLLTTEILAFRGPLLIAPAMNPAMYTHPAVQENIQKLSSRGVKLVGPDNGLTSCGEEGPGRMLEPAQIVEQVAAAFYSVQNSKKLLITLGPTRSPIDPVRFITNRSSGIMGAALCWAAVEKGYQVTAICGPVEVPLPSGTLVHKVQTAEEMANIAQQEWPSHDVFISTAAVLDWDVKNPASQKLKKEDGQPQIELVRNTDILACLCKEKREDQYVLGFAAETDDPIFNAQKKLKQKGCNAIFANDVSQPSQGFESQLNGGWWITSDQILPLETAHKTEVARKLIALIDENHTRPIIIPQRSPYAVYAQNHYTRV